MILLGHKDEVTKEFMDDNTYFADFCNQYLYDGEQILQPEQLHTLNPKLPISKNKKKIKTTREKSQERDVIKYITAKTDDKKAYLLIGIENQSDIDYAMPARIMLYDGLQYKRQRQEITRKHRNDKEYDDFTSGFQKGDKMLPVITLVVYFGSKPWDGPMCLHEMLDVDDSHILQYVEDYKIHLIDPHRMDEDALNKFQTNAREVMTFIKYARDGNKLLELVQEPRFQSIDLLAAEVIDACTNANIPLIVNEEDDVNMCEGIDKIREDSRNEGRDEKAKEMAVALLKEKVFSNNKIAELTKLTIDEINKLQREQLQHA